MGVKSKTLPQASGRDQLKDLMKDLVQSGDSAHKTYTRFRRYGELFKYLDEEIMPSLKGRETQALVIGGGASQPEVMEYAGDDFTSKDRAYSFEHLELASLFMKHGLDWRITLIEKDPRVREVIKRQKTVLVTDIQPDTTPADLQEFLPGAHRKRLTAGADRIKKSLAEKDIHREALEAQAVQIPDDIRKRTQVIGDDILTADLPENRYDLVLYLSVNQWLLGQPPLPQICRSIRKGGYLVANEIEGMEKALEHTGFTKKKEIEKRKTTADGQPATTTEQIYQKQ